MPLQKLENYSACRSMKIFVVIFCLCCGGISFCFQGTPVEAEIVDKIVAILDEELILLSEVRECTEKPVARVIANLDASGDVERDVLRYMIERQLLLRRIQYLAFPKEKELVRTLATQYIINTYHNKNAQAFAEKVQTQGITEIEIEFSEAGVAVQSCIAGHPDQHHLKHPNSQ